LSPLLSAGEHAREILTLRASIALGPERSEYGCTLFALHTKKTYLAAQFRRVAAKRGKQRAIVAVAHSIVVAAFYILKRNEVYREAGGDYFERANPAGLQRYLVRRLERLLGHKVVLEPANAA